jgi:tetratricopeptide (TPR) repeat protein
VRRRILIRSTSERRSALIAFVVFCGACLPSRGQDDRGSPAPKTEPTAGTIKLQSTPDDPRTLATRGDDHAASGDLDEAIADYTQAIALDPRYAYAYSRRASAWVRKLEHGKAIDDYSVAIALEPRNPFHFLSRGQVWARQGSHVPAIADFDEAIRLAPNDPGAYLTRATEWEKDLQWDRAISDYQKAIALDARLTPAYEGRGRVWAKRGEFENLLANFAELARMVPDDPVGHREVAWLLATCDQDSVRDGRRALGEATIACNLTKWKDPRCLESLAAAHAEVGDFDSAVEWQTRALQVFTAGNDKADRRIKFRQDAAMNLRLYRYKRRMPHHERPDRAG